MNRRLRGSGDATHAQREHALHLHKQRRETRSKVSKTVHTITSRTAEQATPAGLAQLIRNHRKPGSTPRATATRRNLRHDNRNASRPLALPGLT